jgi:hypothetical protein
LGVCPKFPRIEEMEMFQLGAINRKDENDGERRYILLCLSVD